MNRKQRRAERSEGGRGGGGGRGGDTRMDRAMLLHRDGRLMEADALYRQILDDNPRDADALRMRGALAYQIGNAGAATELLAAARKADPNNAEVLSLLGLAMDAAGNRDGAEKAYRKALSLAPKSAEIWNNLGVLLREDGRVREAAEALGRAVVLKPDYLDAYRNLGATLTRMGSLDAALAAYDAGLQLAPGDADLLLNRGVTLSAAGRDDAARACFEQVLEQAPDDPDALTNLASTQMRLEDIEGAEETARRALALAPESAGAMANLAMMLSAGRHFEEAEALYHDALRAAPDYADIWGNYANMLMAADRLEEAEVAYAKARKLAPGDARHAFQLGLCKLNRGELDAGWQLYESGFDCEQRVAAAAPDLPRWKGGAMPGKRLLIIPEQGIGDEIRNLSCLPDVQAAAGADATIVLGADPRLHSLIRRRFPGVVLAPRDALTRVRADAAIPCASLPGLFRRKLADFPAHTGYLEADPERMEAMREQLSGLGSGIKVGIAWRSGLRRLRSAQAVTEIADWQPVLDVPGAQFVNLQYALTPGELDGLPVAEIPDLDLRDDIDGAAALAAACDLVISMGTSVAELAGALGVPCWSLQLKPSWITLGAERHPFYPQTELFWRMPEDDWTAVLRRVAERLDAVTRPREA
jgi:tetratricopeptide (TPR) repeat protein